MAIVSPLNVLFVIKGVLGNYISKKNPSDPLLGWSRVSDIVEADQSQYP